MTFFSPALDDRIRHLQVQTLYKHAPGVYVSNFLNALLVVVVMWPSGVSTLALVIWCACMYLLTAFRSVTSWYYWRDAEREKPAHITKWQRLFTGSGLLSGLLWGLAGFLFYLPEDGGIYQAFIVIVLLGIGGGGMAFTSSHLPTFYTFFSMLMFPLIIRILMVGGVPHMVMGGMIVIYYFVFIFFARNVNQIFLETILMRFDNLELVDKLTHEKEEAEKANITKSKFLAAASHDLRQPLHALSLLAGALAERIQYKEVKDIVMKIRAAVVALENMFNALLDISKLDSGVLQPCIEEFSLRTIFERIENDQRPEAEKKGLKFEVCDCGNVLVSSDSILLERILRNFVSNAVRYTQAGEVVLSCEKKGDMLEIIVRDTGIGIPQNYHGKIFDEYVQLDNAERNRNKGLGLGLAIVSRIARLLGHEVHLESKEGEGSTFSVKVPCREGVAVNGPVQTMLPEFSKDLHKLVVLVIDDEVAILEALKVLLGGWGCDVILAETVEQARQALQSRELKPDAVIADYRLRDGINGVEAIKAIESMVGYDLPAILITGDMEVNLKNELSEAYRVLHKPVQPARLRAFLKFVQNSKLDAVAGEA